MKRIRLAVIGAGVAALSASLLAQGLRPGVRAASEPTRRRAGSAASPARDHQRHGRLAD